MDNELTNSLSVLSQQASKIQPFQLRSRIWSPQEDCTLRQLVRELGNNWTEISKYFPDKSTRSVRERWSAQLNPEFNRGPLSLEQEWLLYLGVQFYGTRWSQIANMCDRRSPKMLKNYWKMNKMREKERLFEDALKQLFLAQGCKEVRKIRDQ